MTKWSLMPPLEVLATWPPPSDDPVIRGPGQYIVTAVFGAIASIAVFARLYTRIFTRRYFGFDDGLIVLAYLAAIGVSATCTIGSVRYQWDRHVWDFDRKYSKSAAFVLYLARIFWGLASSCVRLSILCLFYRLLASVEAPRSFLWTLHVVTAFTVLFLFELLFTSIIPCMPLEAYWEYIKYFSTGDHYTCINDFRSFQFAAVFNTVSEVVLATLPVIAVFRIRVDPKQRWNVIALLSLSFFVAIAGICRSYFLWQIVETYDTTWYASPHWISAEVEIDVALTCACAAPLGPPIFRLWRRLRGVTNSVTSVARKMSNAKSTKLSSSTTATSSQQQSGKFEGIGQINELDRNHWVNQMSRTIDLEGIGEDGFGYTVTIQGPYTRRKPDYLSSRLRRWNALSRARKAFDNDQISRRPSSANELTESKFAKVVRSVDVSDEVALNPPNKPRPPVCWEGNMRPSIDQGKNSDFVNDDMRHWTFLESPQAYD